LKTPNAASLRAVRKELSQQVATSTAKVVTDLALQIVEQRAPGGHVIAYELIRYHPTALARVGPRYLQRFGKRMDSWGEVDTFGGLAGRAWRKQQVPDAAVHRWARSGNRWWRRAALVSTVPLNVRAQGGHGDVRRTLAVCRLLLDDRDDMVVKAMSWALRALAVRAPAAVSRFVEVHEKALAARVVREVRNKLRTGRKDSRRVNSAT
jgi:3-methyladenine DNA glycosylase AlkD